jgi:peptide/nickel transport system permease protein
MAIIIGIFPQLITPYTFLEAIGIPGGAWNPPSPDHPLGQAEFGRDVLARIVYGIQSSLTVLIGIFIFSLMFGIIIGAMFIVIKIYSKSTHRWLNYGLMGLIVILFIIPTIIILPYFIAILSNIFIMMMIIGLILALLYALIISNSKMERENIRNGISNILKRFIIYTPILITLMFFIYESFNFINFLGVSISLGQDISVARGQLITAPWATFYPGLALAIYTLGFLLLHFGLKEGLDTNLR